MSSNSELLDHISKLTNAIQQRRLEQQRPQYPQRPPPSSHATYHRNTTAGRGRGSFIPGYPATTMNQSTHRHTGFPYNKSLVLDNTKQSPKPYASSPTTAIRPSPGRPPTFMNKTLNNNPSPVLQQRPKHDPAAFLSATRPPTSTPHRTLVLSSSTVSNKRSRPNTAAASSSHLPRQSQHKKLIIRHSKEPDAISTSTSTYNNSAGQKIVVINGVSFINMGKKLVRQDVLGKPTSTTMGNSRTPRVLIRKLVKRRDRSNNLVLRKQQQPIKRQRMDRKGNAVYIRKPEGYEQKGINGNTLVLKNSSATMKLQRSKKPTTKSTYCGTFTRYGTCPKATRCPFLHDRNRVAICVGYLMTKTCRNGTRCRLSHSPTPHNTPHCRHFQRMRCSNDPCPFAHIRVRPDAPLCRPFGVEGYCSKGSMCKNLHVIVCPTFAVLGKCTNQRCKFPHVASTAAIKKDAPPTPATSNTATPPATVKKTQWIRPELKASLDHQRKEMNERKIEEKHHQQQNHERQRLVDNEKQMATNDDDGDDRNNGVTEDDGFVPLFGDEDDNDDAEWGQYLIKNPEDVEEINSLRFGDFAESNQENDDDDDGDDVDNDDDDADDDRTDNDNQDDEGFVYEEISDEDMAGDDSSVEEIYEEVSDLDDDIDDVGNHVV